MNKKNILIISVFVFLAYLILGPILGFFIGGGFGSPIIYFAYYWMWGIPVLAGILIILNILIRNTKSKKVIR